MPSADGLRLSSSSPKDGLFFNAFEDSGSTCTTASTSIMVSAQGGSTPRKRRSLKRRGSDSTPSSPSWSGQATARPLGHSRSQTTQGSYAHPLGNATFSSGGPSVHLGLTRPHLSRIMSAWETSYASDGEAKGSSSDGGSIFESNAPPQQERTVLVHEVSWHSCRAFR